MAKLTPGMSALLQEKERLEGTMFRLFEQSEAIRNKIAGIDIAISILEKGDQPATAEGVVSATNLKVLLLDLARETTTTGINANTAVELARKRGIKLLRGSAASNLSRLKTDGALMHDGTVYRLPEFVRPQPPGQVLVGGTPQVIIGGKSS